MLEMQRLSPEMRKLQNEYRNDRTKLNEEMMKLYQEHKVNPMASCLPVVAQMPIFLIMFRVLRGLTYAPRGAALPVAQSVWKSFEGAGLPYNIPEEVADPGFIPRYLAVDSALYEALFSEHSMPSIALDLSLSAAEAVGQGFGTGLPYVLLVVLLGGLYFLQQRMVAARAAVSPTMSVSQQKLMQYLPVFFAIFQIFFLSALVVYYVFQTLLRIAQQAYITRAFYGHDESLGRQAQRAGEKAREEAKKSGESGGFLAQAKRDLGGAAADKGSDKGDKNAGKKTGDKNMKGSSAPAREITNKRVTPPKNRPTPSSGAKGRPTPSRKEAQAKKAKSSKSSRPKSSKKNT
jgi:YidC/Oxa1 family membrane protein insertase